MPNMPYYMPYRPCRFVDPRPLAGVICYEQYWAYNGTLLWITHRVTTVELKSAVFKTLPPRSAKREGNCLY